jgi:hypothetical protein
MIDTGVPAVPSFALIGAAGFIAPRHMKAIKEVGGRLVAALDPILVEHRDRIFKAHFRDPMEF